MRPLTSVPARPAERHGYAGRVGTTRHASTSPRRREDGRSAEVRGTARARLLDAAEQVLAESGYDGASVTDIVTRAALTKGAFYWNFASKQDLFYALIEERLDRRVRGLVETLASDETPLSLSEALIAIVDEQRPLFMLTREFWSLAVRDPELGERYVERQRSLRAAIAAALAARVGVGGTEADRLATVLIALANGLAEQRVADPTAVPDDLLGDVLSLLYAGLAARAAGG